MELLTKEILAKLPGLGTTEENKKAKSVIKLFNPHGRGTWWAFEFDPRDSRFYGVAEISEKQIGYFRLKDIENHTGKLGFDVKRDTDYTPQTMSEIMGW